MVTGFVRRAKGWQSNKKIPQGAQIKVSLKVVDWNPVTAKDEASVYTKHVYVNPESALGEYLDDLLLITNGATGDFVLSVRPSPEVPPGCIAISESQRINLRIGTSSVIEWHNYEPPEHFELADITLEVRFLPGYEGEGEGDAQIDAAALATYIKKQFFNHFLSVNEHIVAPAPDRPGVYVVFRVAEVTGAYDEDDDSPLTEHFFRGMLTTDTQIFITKEPAAHQHLQKELLPADFTLLNATAKAASTTPAKRINIVCNDEEVFCVKKALLKPCISLTKFVRDQNAAVPTANVDIGCLLFDKILLYLEAEARGDLDTFVIDINLAEDYLNAARYLGLRGLEESAMQLMGDFESRIRYYSFEEVLAKTKEGQCWILIDGMVIDVTRWLPEHPGGSTIIPQQTLGVDATVFFELYHASRESFLYLKQFYIGELKLEDIPKVPKPDKGDASIDFYEQLRTYTPFRLTQRVANHLGAN